MMIKQIEKIYNEDVKNYGKEGAIFLCICVVLGFIVGYFGVLAIEGVSYAIIICNLLVPVIEKITVPKPFGSVKAKGDVH